VRIDVVDPPAYTPPYDRALSAALARAGAEVTLRSGAFNYGEVASAEGYRVDQCFGGMLKGRPGSPLRAASRLVAEMPEMLRYRRIARQADLVHFQWLPLPQIGASLLPTDRPVVITAHDVVPREPRPGQIAGLRRAYARADAVVVHSEDGSERLQRELGVAGERCHVIPHGTFTHLAEIANRAPLPQELAAVEGPVALCFGLMRPYKGLDVAIEAWRGITDAELWIVGLPRMDTAPLKASAPKNVRFVERFIEDREIPAFFERAELVLLPYREIDHSGVCFTALAFGTPMLLSDVGGFPEIAAAGAAELVPAGDAAALRTQAQALLSDAAARQRLAAGAATAARDLYDWDRVAALHLELYSKLIGGGAR